MKTEETKHERQIENERPSRLRRHAINQLAFGSIIVFWGSLLMLKQAGVIQKNVSTWLFPLAAFGILLVAGGIYRLSRSG
jgi:hypothetical protein